MYVTWALIPHQSLGKTIGKGKKGIGTKVHFTGRILNTQLPALLGNAGLYISMPTTEGVSASLFEAMAAGSYPIVTDIPGNQSWITHRKNGLLVPVDDARQLAEAIVWFHEHPAEAAIAVRANRDFVEKEADYSQNMQYIAGRYHQLIENSTNN
ncbi:MAG: glycosyltransferase [Sphingobacteriales bacterium]|nr:MAG: glycosyltransferase [Sphingobacteriales bacterium]